MYYQIKGFKGLKKTTKLDLAPLTILVGKNGSGKSSAISALNKIKDISLIKNSFNDNKMESSLQFNELKRTDFGCEIGSQLEYTFPINLSFFEDKFELRTKYHANNDYLNLSKFEVFNKSKNEIFFHISGEDLVQKTDSTANFKKQKIVVQINLDFLITEFKRLKNKKPFDWSEFKFMPVEEGEKEFELEQKKFKEFIKNLEVGFNEYKDNFKIKNQEFNEIKARMVNFDELKSTLDDLRLFVIQKEDETIDAGDYINELTNAIQKGIEFEHNSSITGISFFITQLFNAKSTHTIFSHEFLSNSQSTSNGYNLPNVLEAKITTTPFFKEIIDEMLMNNIHSNSSYLLENSKFNYIPPNRIGKFSTNNESSAGFALKELTKALNYLGYSDKSSSFFINYWFRQFDISEEIYNLELALKLLDDSQNIEKEGYGIQQIIPLIIILSLSQRLHNTDLSSEDPWQWMNSGYDVLEYENIKKFLIEEPEANLHPSFQSKLADLFLDAWIKYDHEFVIETHSEYLIRKLQYHVGTGKIDPSIINIYYFDKNEKPRKINIKKDGSLSAEFGSGFYDEADNIAIDLFMLNKKQLN